jgi:hypothetical protein
VCLRQADDINRLFMQFKREISLTSENTRTGQPIPERIVDEFERMEVTSPSDLDWVQHR